ncbi:PRC-barrel domain-containing protein [Daejeonella oryzae]|uniref:PRC-barrel domain-containing protein n=1 Tax=Daejeonella oryzae TaxID=1122943 RepID=UPI00041680E6|nr:PRC-barrel domain-containing protein [Daejeonella oryzae]
MSSNNNDYSHLKELGKSNYEIADGESDIRNWVVKNETGNILGEVDELILDTNAGKAVFIVLNLDKNELNLKERKVLLPLEYAEVHQSYKNVIYKGLMPNEIAVLPSYEKGKFSRNSIDLTRSTFLSAMNNDNSQQAQSKSSACQSAEVHPDSPVTSERSHTELPNSAAHNLDRGETRSFVEHQRTNASASDTKEFTVVGVFEHSRQSQAVIEYLLNHGFNKDDVTVSTRQSELSHEHYNRDESGITHFFKSLFNNEDDVKRYSDATERNYVVSVDVPSSEQAEEVANILDQHGSLNMRNDHNALVNSADGKTGYSRVFKRHSNK